MRVHEEPFRLGDHGYAARVDELLPQTAYKFAVILTNEVGTRSAMRAAQHQLMVVVVRRVWARTARSRAISKRDCVVRAQQRTRVMRNPRMMRSRPRLCRACAAADAPRMIRNSEHVTRV